MVMGNPGLIWVNSVCLHREAELREQYLRQAKAANELREELAGTRRQLEAAQRQLALSTQFIDQHLRSSTPTKAEVMAKSAPFDDPVTQPTSPEHGHIAAHAVTPESELTVISPIRPVSSEGTGKRRSSGSKPTSRSNAGDSSPGLRAEVRAAISLIDRLVPPTSARSFR